MNRIVRSLIVALMLGLGSLEIAEAQPARSQQFWTRPVRPSVATGRFLGLGYGNGYHWRNSGPDSDYYNPYSEHNSSRITSSREYQDGLRPYDSSGGMPGHIDTMAPQHPYSPPAHEESWPSTPKPTGNNRDRSPVPADRLDPFGNEIAPKSPGVSASPDWKLIL